ncbi:EndoU domain-containing protein [filamentous cyanobacterium LEGE 11480]|uniref:EndoU domain-containing protein n=1 Tax=Romeriopsis navalis LEGE 11480 TaxID=2777977 RepID=A0A928VQ69_9CYAN|nr:EndoU domain-containing protein [Romeriopsis navalis]MBE9032475.1 EndoU domain-containing protein [Romeriopsis navalis LEGE 11480]
MLLNLPSLLLPQGQLRRSHRGRASLTLLTVTSLVCVVVVSGQSAVSAQTKAPQKFFKASRACEATRSIRRGGNPGNIKLQVDRIYSTLGLNRRNGSHVLLKIEEANPTRRWVPLNCGKFQSQAGESVAPAPRPDPILTPIVAPPGACKVEALPKVFFDRNCSLVPVSNVDQPQDIAPPAPVLSAFDRRVVELCGKQFDAPVSANQFEQLMRDYPDVRQRLQNEVGGSLRQGRTTSAQFIRDLSNAWFKADGFRHIFCGDKGGSASSNTGIGGLHFSGRYLDLQSRGLAEMIRETRRGKDAIEEVVPGVIYTFGVKVKLPNGQTLNHFIKGYGYTLNAQEILLYSTKAFKRSTAQACLITIRDITVAPFPVQGVTFKAKFVRKNGAIRTFYPMAKPKGKDC